MAKRPPLPAHPLGEIERLKAETEAKMADETYKLRVATACACIVEHDGDRDNRITALIKLRAMAGVPNVLSNR